VVIAGVLIIALALIGISFAPSFLALCLLMAPLGFGGGSIDAALNSFVSVHYKAWAMNWLHCCWGVGATIGPMIMSRYLGGSLGWRYGYRTVSYIQFAIVIILLCSLPLWKKARDRTLQESETGATVVTNAEAFRTPGVKYALLAFLCYCGVEASAGVWAASYLVEQIGITKNMAAAWTAYYYAGITVGRFLSGIITTKVPKKQLIRYGCVLSLTGALVLLLSFTTLDRAGLELSQALSNEPGIERSQEYPSESGLELSQALLDEPGYEPGMERSQELTGGSGLGQSQAFSDESGAELDVERSQELTGELGLKLSQVFSLIGFVLIGFGGAPFFPCMIHETPGRFGLRISQAAIGLQMASAYLGSMFVPLIVGQFSGWLSLAILPWCLCLLIVGMFLLSEVVDRKAGGVGAGR